MVAPAKIRTFKHLQALCEDVKAEGITLVARKQNDKNVKGYWVDVIDDTGFTLCSTGPTAKLSDLDMQGWTALVGETIERASLACGRIPSQSKVATDKCLLIRGLDDIQEMSYARLQTQIKAAKGKRRDRLKRSAVVFKDGTYRNILTGEEIPAVSVFPRIREKVQAW